MCSWAFFVRLLMFPELRLMLHLGYSRAAGRSADPASWPVDPFVKKQ